WKTPSAQGESAPARALILQRRPRRGDREPVQGCGQPVVVGRASRLPRRQGKRDARPTKRNKARAARSTRGPSPVRRFVKVFGSAQTITLSAPELCWASSTGRRVSKGSLW